MFGEKKVLQKGSKKVEWKVWGEWLRLKSATRLEERKSTNIYIYIYISDSREVVRGLFDWKFFSRGRIERKEAEKRWGWRWKDKKGRKQRVSEGKRAKNEPKNCICFLLSLSLSRSIPTYSFLPLPLILLIVLNSVPLPCQSSLFVVPEIHCHTRWKRERKDCPCYRQKICPKDECVC